MEENGGQSNGYHHLPPVRHRKPPATRATGRWRQMRSLSAGPVCRGTGDAHSIKFRCPRHAQRRAAPCRFLAFMVWALPTDGACLRSGRPKSGALSPPWETRHGKRTTHCSTIHSIDTNADTDFFRTGDSQKSRRHAGTGNCRLGEERPSIMLPYTMNERDAPPDGLQLEPALPGSRWRHGRTVGAST